MKRIALIAAALSLGAGAAFAGTTNTAPSSNAASHPAAHHPQVAAAYQRNNQTENRMTKALNLLEAKGYASFTNFKPAGNDFSATVTEKGHDMTVRVDPDSGQITTAS